MKYVKRPPKLFCAGCRHVWDPNLAQNTANIFQCPKCNTNVSRESIATFSQIVSASSRARWGSMTDDQRKRQFEFNQLKKFSPAYKRLMARKAEYPDISDPRLKRFCAIMERRFAHAMSDRDFRKDRRPNVIRYTKLSAGFVIRNRDEFAIRVHGVVHWIIIIGKPLIGMVTPIGHVVRRPVLSWQKRNCGPRLAFDVAKKKKGYLSAKEYQARIEAKAHLASPSVAPEHG